MNLVPLYELKYYYDYIEGLEEKRVRNMIKARKKRGESKQAFHYSQMCCYTILINPRGLFILQALPHGSIDISTHGMLDH